MGDGKKLTPFDFLNSINSKTNTDLDTAQYTPFMVNRGLSYFRDTVHWANEMNRYSALSNDQQYAFLLNIVKKGKRFGKWEKSVADENIDLIISFYQCNRQRAQEIAKILNKEQLKAIADKMFKGGK